MQLNCPKCGNQVVIPDGMNQAYCTICGNQIPAPEAQTEAPQQEQPVQQEQQVQPQQPQPVQQFQQFQQNGQPVQQFQQGGQVFQQTPGQQQASFQQPAQPQPQKSNPAILIVIIIGAVLGFIVLIAILAAILIPALGAARERGRIASCTNNMKQIGLSLIMYTDANDGYYPDTDTKNKLVTSPYMVHENVFICPSGDGIADYRFYSEGLSGFKIKNQSTLPIAICCTHDKKLVVLYADGHVGTEEIPYPLTTNVEMVEYVLGINRDTYDKSQNTVLSNARKLDRGW